MNKEILEITKNFHDMYEKLASEYTYETREDTKVFDISSNNGKLMYATVNEIVSPILKENQELNQKYLNAVADYETTMAEKEQLKKQLEDKTEDYKRMKDNFDSKVDVLTEIDTQQKEFINFLEDNYKETQDIWYIKILQKYKSIIGDDK